MIIHNSKDCESQNYYAEGSKMTQSNTYCIIPLIQLPRTPKLIYSVRIKCDCKVRGLIGKGNKGIFYGDGYVLLSFE